ncbi:DUF2752 domain-containing protein [bacterium]|nr:DUF2752 domain-containing protein [bacterium]
MTLEISEHRRMPWKEQPGYPVAAGGRWSLMLCSLALLAGFLLAAALEPDPRGYGTHQRLGLPECSFQMLFNRPCPGCGMTTSFAHFVRGHWRQSFAANPAGWLLAITCAGIIPWCWWSAYRGCLWLVSDPWKTSALLMGTWGTVTLTCWLWRFW